MLKSMLQVLFNGEIFPAKDINTEETNPGAKEISKFISKDKEYFA